MTNIDRYAVIAEFTIRITDSSTSIDDVKYRIRDMIENSLAKSDIPELVSWEWQDTQLITHAKV